MKKIFTLIIALTAFVMGSQTVRAEATETLVGTIKTGTVFNNPEDNNYIAYLLLLNYFHQLNMDFDEDTKDNIISNLDGKVLFTLDENQTVTLAPGVTSADNIFYTITDEDRNSLRSEPEAYEFVAPYETIELHFDTSGGGGNGEGGATETLEFTVKSGMNIYDDENEDVNFFLSLLFNLGQIHLTEEQWVVSTETGKVLFTLSEEGIITVSADVTSDDDIFYTFTDADRAYFKEEDLDKFMEPYAAIKLHLVPGSGGGGNVDLTALSGTIKNGMSFEDSENAWLAYTLLLNYFNQIRMDVDMTGNRLHFSLANKLLFTLDKNEIIIIADGVTSDDDIIYTITDEDRERLRKTDVEAYTFLAPYTTVELHFDTSGGGGNGEGGGNGGPLIPEQRGTLGTQGYWTFADGVLTVVYDGAMPTLTSKSDHADDPETAYRFKWIDFLSEIKEIVVTGKDVEIQPYFLYYEGEGTSDGQHPDDHIKTVTLGSGVKSLGRASLSLYELKRVNCYGINAPTLPVPHKAFWEKRITANLAFLWTVPNASTDYAKMNSEWAKFNHSATHLNPDDMPATNNLADFETGKLNQAPFFSEGEYPWNVTNEDADGGTFSMKSGNKGVANTSSAISAMYLFETDGFIYFTAKCMGEGQGSGWDKCLFYIDGEQQFSYGALGDRWSSYSFPVKAGMHTFKWEYTKDSSVDPTGDGFFVDNIYFLQEGKDDDLITGIESLTPTLSEGERAWFDLSGRKLAGKPTQKGIYVNSGKKVMIK